MKKDIAFITGGATGIGAGVSEKLASQGIRVAICDVNEKSGKELARKLEGKFIYCDVSNLGSVENAAKTCVDNLGIPDFVHLNAGIMTVPTGDPFLAIEDVSEDQYERIVGINLSGVFHGLKTLLPTMRKQGGCITITASTAGLSVVPLDPMYTATKYGLIGLGRAVAAANEGSRVRINVICPGVTDTQIVPDQYKSPEFSMMSTDIIAAEITDLLFNGSNGEVRVKVRTDLPAFKAEIPDLN